MVDYSKWDTLDASDDEGKGKPRVHAFKEPQTVTIGGAGRPPGQVRVVPSSASKPAECEEEADDEPMEPDDEELEEGRGQDLREAVLQCRALAERALRDGAPGEAVRLLEKAMRAGGAHCPGLEDVLASARRQVAALSSGPAEARGGPGPHKEEARKVNGGTVEGRYSWSQTRDTVEVNLFVPEATKAKDVAVKVEDKSVRVTLSGTPLLEGEWEFKVDPEEDPDWEVCNLQGRRVVRLTVRKAVVPGGFSVVVWWKRVLKGDQAIDIADVEGRKRERAEAFAKAWEEAHVQFREKARHREPIPIDVGGDGDAPMEE